MNGGDFEDGGGRGWVGEDVLRENSVGEGETHKGEEDHNYFKNHSAW